MKKFLASLMALGLVLALAPVSMASDEKDKDKKAEELSETREELVEATLTLKEILGIPEDGIPQAMLDNAAAIVVIPDLIKAGFIAGVKHGDGVMSARGAKGWSHPVFVSLTGGSVGWQAGVESTDLVLVFMKEKSAQQILNGEFTLGADASVAIGPVGRQASAGTNFDSEVYAYSRSKGIFAGISLDGSKLSIDEDDNLNYYGAGTMPKDLLFGVHAKAPKESDEFKMTLNHVTKKSKS